MSMVSKGQIECMTHTTTLTSPWLLPSHSFYWCTIVGCFKKWRYEYQRTFFSCFHWVKSACQSRRLPREKVQCSKHFELKMKFSESSLFPALAIKILTIFLSPKDNVRYPHPPLMSWCKIKKQIVNNKWPMSTTQRQLSRYCWVNLSAPEHRASKETVDMDP